MLGLSLARMRPGGGAWLASNAAGRRRPLVSTFLSAPPPTPRPALPYSDEPPPPPPPLPWGTKRLKHALECVAGDAASMERAHVAECVSPDLWLRAAASLRRRLARSPPATVGGSPADHSPSELAALLPEELAWDMAVVRDGAAPLEALCDDADVYAKDLAASRAASAKAAEARARREALAAQAAGGVADSVHAAGTSVPRRKNDGFDDSAFSFAGRELLAADRWGFLRVSLGGRGSGEGEGEGGAGALTPIEELEAANRAREAAASEAKEAAAEAARAASLAAIEARGRRIASALYPLVVSQAGHDPELRAELGRLRTLRASSDMERPHEWYPAARLMKRRVIYHGGPTNSGKTYHALQALRKADPAKGGGVFCGPLRLLALEVYEQLNTEGVYCSLMTGQERKEVEFAAHTSCTIEMVNVNQPWDVAVIDEIQMIGNATRGFAWTRALLGLQAREVHVCGSLEAESLVRRLCEVTGDDFELVTYDRMTPLKVLDEPLGDYSKVQAGDCVVAFSRQDIFRIREAIERLTPHKCCVVFGQLPPETRSKQAHLFNAEGSGYDVLVASDAVGMGLNLNIRRIVFHATMKIGDVVLDGKQQVEASMMKQIAGRAGRRSSQYKDQGMVTCLHAADMPWLKESLALPVKQVAAAGLFPAVEHLQAFSNLLDKLDAADARAKKLLQRQQVQVTGAAAASSGSSSGRSGGGSGGGSDSGDDDTWDEYSFPFSSASSSPPATVELAARRRKEPAFVNRSGKRPLSETLAQFFSSASCAKGGLYFVTKHDEVAKLANRLHDVTSPMPLHDAFTFCMAPVKTNDRLSFSMLNQFADAWAKNKPTALNINFKPSAPTDVLELTDLCVKHNICDLYLWLANRFPGNFVEKSLALRQKAHAITLIQEGLREMDLDLEDIAGLGYGGGRAAATSGKGSSAGFRKALAANHGGGKGPSKGVASGKGGRGSGKGESRSGKEGSKGGSGKGGKKAGKVELRSGGGGGSSGRAMADVEKALGGAAARGVVSLSGGKAQLSEGQLRQKEHSKQKAAAAAASAV